MSGPRVSSPGCQGSLMNEPEVLVPKRSSSGLPSERAVRAAAAHPPVRNQKMMSAMMKTTSEIMRTRFIIAVVYLVSKRSLFMRAQDAQRLAQALARTLYFLRHFAQRVPCLRLRVSERAPSFQSPPPALKSAAPALH